MINKLSIKQYISQKTDKQACDSIGKAIAAAIGRAWGNCEYSEQVLDSIVAQTSDYNIKGYRFSFNIDEILIPEETVYMAEDETTDTMMNIITDNGKYGKTDIDTIHTYMLLKHQPWSVVENTIFKHLKEYLDLKGMILITTDLHNKTLEKYYYTDKNKYLTSIIEQREKGTDISDITHKTPLIVSHAMPPESYKGANPKIMINLILTTKSAINKAMQD
jgi:hypothetical protein